MNRPDDFPRWIDWARFFTVQERIGAVLSNRDLSPLLQASELRRVFDELQPVLTEGGSLSAFAASRNDTGVAFTKRSLKICGSYSRNLRFEYLTRLYP